MNRPARDAIRERTTREGVLLGPATRGEVIALLDAADERDRLQGEKMDLQHALNTEQGWGEPRPGWESHVVNGRVRWIHEVSEGHRLRVLQTDNPGEWDWRSEYAQDAFWIVKQSGFEKIALAAIDAAEAAVAK